MAEVVPVCSSTRSLDLGGSARSIDIDTSAAQNVNPLFASRSKPPSKEAEDSATSAAPAAAAADDDDGKDEPGGVKPASDTAATTFTTTHDDDDAAPPPLGWFVGNTFFDIFLLTAALIVATGFFVLHCTALIDVLVDESDARSWLGVTTEIRVFAGLVLVPAAVLCLRAIIQISCCWKRTLRLAQRTDAVRSVVESKSLALTAWHFIWFVLSPESSYYFIVIELLEIKEFVFQALALEQMSRGGVGQAALTMYTTVILLNGTASFAMTWIVNRRINIIDDSDGLRRRAEASKWVSRMLLLDATCDLFYACFGVGILLVRLSRIFADADDSSIAEVRIVQRYNHAVLGKDINNDMRAYMLLSEGENTLFGGKPGHGFDSFVKFVSRVLPLMQIPFIVMSSFTIRQNLSAGRTPAAAAAGRRPISGSSFRVRSVRTVRANAFKGRYTTIPRWIAGVQYAIILAFSLFVYIQAWNWGDCAVPEIARSCAVRAYPIFKIYGNDAAWSCRACACNTLFIVSEDCNDDGTTITSTANATSQQWAGAGSSPSGCLAEHNDETVVGNSDVGRRLPSQVLNFSGAILEPAVTIFIAACPADSALLGTLALHVTEPGVMRINMLPVVNTTNDNNTTHTNNASVRGKLPAVAFNGDDAVAVPWAFPPAFGFRPEGHEPWPLTVFDLSDEEALRLRHRGSKRIRASRAPAAIWAMTGLKVLKLQGLDLDWVPEEIGRLTLLKNLDISDNAITSVPSTFGHLSALMYLRVRGNRIAKLPSELGELSALWNLELSETSLSSVPPFIGRLTGLKDIGLGVNWISFIPSFVGRLTNLENLYLRTNLLEYLPEEMRRLNKLHFLDLQNNSLSSIPPFIDDLVSLRTLNLAENMVTMVPGSFFTARRINGFLVNLKANNISLEAMTEALERAASTFSLPSSQDSESSSEYLATMGRNPACTTARVAGAAASPLPSRLGLWRIECEPECAAGCQTVISKYVKSWVGDGLCHWECNTIECSWDGGDCS